MGHQNLPSQGFPLDPLGIASKVVPIAQVGVPPEIQDDRGQGITASPHPTVPQISHFPIIKPKAKAPNFSIVYFKSPDSTTLPKAVPRGLASGKRFQSANWKITIFKFGKSTN